MRILIVEDERIQSTSLKLKLASLNYCDVQVADNGEEALTLCAKQHFSLIFCDIHMPEMDGISLLTQLSEQPHRPAIVILSAVVKRLRLRLRPIKSSTITSRNTILPRVPWLGWKLWSD